MAAAVLTEAEAAVARGGSRTRALAVEGDAVQQAMLDTTDTDVETAPGLHEHQVELELSEAATPAPPAKMGRISFRKAR